MCWEYHNNFFRFSASVSNARQFFFKCFFLIKMLPRNFKISFLSLSLKSYLGEKTVQYSRLLDISLYNYNTKTITLTFLYCSFYSSYYKLYKSYFLFFIRIFIIRNCQLWFLFSKQVFITSIIILYRQCFNKKMEDKISNKVKSKYNDF